jgi:hypothetical protein
MSPVASTLIPVIVGLLGAIGFRQAAQQIQSSALADHVLKIPEVQGLTDVTQNTIRQHVIAFTGRPTWLPTIAGIGILAFFCACYLGMLFGIRNRVPQYPTLTTVLPKVTSASPVELASLYRLTWHLKSSGLPPEQYSEAMAAIFDPIFKADSADQAARTELVLGAVAQIAPKEASVKGLSLPDIFLKADVVSMIDSIDNKRRQNLITDKQAYEELRQHLKGETP